MEFESAIYFYLQWIIWCSQFSFSEILPAHVPLIHSISKIQCIKKAQLNNSV